MHQPGSCPAEILIMTSAALDDFEGRQDSAVALTLKNAKTVQARWEENGVAQCREYAAGDLDRLPPFPAEPKRFASLEASFLKSLDVAAQTAARDRGRAALIRLQLRGQAGEIVGTDGRQLLIQRGIVFPWKDDVLIPSLAVFGCPELLGAGTGAVAIGKTETHICLRVGRWKFFLEIDRAARYPRIDQVIPLPSRNGTTFHIEPQDAAFLLQTMPKLPGRDQENAIITIDLNGQVAIRAKGEEQASVTELVLSRSKSTGPPVRLVSNRHFFAHAMRMGFTQFHVVKPTVPIVARDRNRIYVFVPLNEESAIPPTADAIRIESAVPTANSSQESSTPRRTKIMPAATTNGHAANGSSDTAGRRERNVSIADLINEAEELRTVVLDVSARVTRLLAGLKQQRRQSRVVQAAMQSLKQIKLDL